jgi:hypothetical protein
MTITKPGEEITEEGILLAITHGEKVAHAIARYFGGDVPDEAIMNIVYQKLDELTTKGIIWQDQNGLYHKF